jgi:hypothetical protein
MKKRARKLALSTETLRTLSEPTLARAVGGARAMTGDPTDCICPQPCAHDADLAMTGDPTDCICPRAPRFRLFR